MIFHVILKILLWLLLWIVLLCIILCFSSVTVAVSFKQNKLAWRIQYFTFQILPRPKKEISATSNSSILPKTKQKKNKKFQKQGTNKKGSHKSEFDKNAAADLNPKKEEKNSERRDFMIDKIWKIMQKIADSMGLANSAVYALPKTWIAFGKAITWCDIQTNILVANEDAAECAKQYGLVQIAVQNLISQAGIWMHVRRKEIKIGYDFAADESSYDVSFQFKIRIGKVLGTGICFLVEFLFYKIKAGKEVSGKRL